MSIIAGVSNEGLGELNRRARDLPWAILACALFAGLSLWQAVVSRGFLEADACTHYLYARFAVGEPHYLVNVWGRPVVTGLYAIPAALYGRLGARVTSLCVALVIGVAAYRIARRQGHERPWLAMLFTLFAPLFYLHSFAELTELPFALVLVLALWAYLHRGYAVMAALVSLLPLARPEGFGFIVLAAVALVLHRRKRWLALLPIPLIAWTWAGWLAFGRPVYDDGLARLLPASWHGWLWLRHEWPYAQRSAYQPGNLLHFVVLLPALVGPLVFPGLFVGIWRNLRGAVRIGAWRDEHQRGDLLIAILPLLILVGHSTLYALGMMASNGELRYLLIVAPFWGLLIARGWETIFRAMRWRGLAGFAWAAVLLPGLVNWWYPVLPLRFSADWDATERIARAYEADSSFNLRYPRLLISHPAFYYFMDVSPGNGSRIVEWRKEKVAAMPPGTLLIWDPSYALFNSDRVRIVTLEEIRAAGWIETDGFAEYAPQGWHIFLSREAIGR